MMLHGCIIPNPKKDHDVDLMELCNEVEQAQDLQSLWAKLQKMILHFSYCDLPGDSRVYDALDHAERHHQAHLLIDAWRSRCHTRRMPIQDRCLKKCWQNAPMLPREVAA